MITKEQYEEAKRIVAQYEHEEGLELSMEDDDDFDGDEDDDFEERQDEEDYERALSCTCGAWIVGKDGKGYHVADCFCGAD